MALDVRYGRVDLDGVPAEEPIFILQASDAAAVCALQLYRDLAESLGLQKKSDEAELSRRRFTAYRIGRDL